MNGTTRIISGALGRAHGLEAKSGHGGLSRKHRGLCPLRAKPFREVFHEQLTFIYLTQYKPVVTTTARVEYDGDFVRPNGAVCLYSIQQ